MTDDNRPRRAVERNDEPPSDTSPSGPSGAGTPADDPWEALLRPRTPGSQSTPTHSAEEPDADHGDAQEPPDLSEDPDSTAVRPALNPDWYRPSDAPSQGRTSDERPWEPDAELAALKVHESPAGPEPVKPARRRHLRSAFLLTLASTILPGSGLLGAPRLGYKVLGAATSLTAIAGGVTLFLRYRANPPRFIAQFTDPDVLRTTMLAMIGIGLVWAVLITITNLATRPSGLSVSKRALSAALVGVLAFAVAAPSALAARYSRDTTLAIEKVAPTGHAEVKSTTRPTLADEDPWADVPRLNILVLGADGNAARADIIETESIRTDTIMVASIDTATGDMTLIQVPRNVQYTPFPAGSEMDELFPDGFRGEGDALEWMVNGIWKTATLVYPDHFPGSTYPGAEALKQGVEGITGLKMDYFVMLNMDGVQELINSMGGVTVNINDRYPMGKDSNPPWSEPTGGWLEKGPDQHLNGYEAMWFARSRSRHSDYDRMARQSCLIDAVVNQANPANLLQRFEAIAAASSDMLLTDIPQYDFPEMVELAFRVKDGSVTRLVFNDGTNGYRYVDPDFPAMRRAVREAIEGPRPTPTPTVAPTTASPTTSTALPTESPSPSVSPSASPTPTDPAMVEGSQDVGDACAYRGD